MSPEDADSLIGGMCVDRKICLQATKSQSDKFPELYLGFLSDCTNSLRSWKPFKLLSSPTADTRCFSVAIDIPKGCFAFQQSTFDGNEAFIDIPSFFARCTHSSVFSYERLKTLIVNPCEHETLNTRVTTSSVKQVEASLWFSPSLRH